jgi:hypothetical protein
MSPLQRHLGFVAMLITAGASAPTQAQNIQCYVYEGPPPFEDVQVRVIDPFGRRTHNVRARPPNRLCVPVRVLTPLSQHGERIAPTITAALPLVCYLSSDTPITPINRNVRVRTRFGTLEIRVLTANGGLCVPSIGDPQTQRYSCFDIDPGPFSPVQVSLDDRFGLRNVTVEEPVLYCVPARIRQLAETPDSRFDQTAEPRPFVCYLTEDPISIFRFFRVSTEFGTFRRRLIARENLCMRVRVLP